MKSSERNWEGALPPLPAGVQDVAAVDLAVRHLQRATPAAADGADICHLRKPSKQDMCI